MSNGAEGEVKINVGPDSREENAMRPACYQDLLDGRTLFDRVPSGEYLEIIPGRGRHCFTISGDTYHMGWRWKGYIVGGGQGHLYKQRYDSVKAFLIATRCKPRLFVVESKNDQGERIN